MNVIRKVLMEREAVEDAEEAEMLEEEIGNLEDLLDEDDFDYEENYEEEYYRDLVGY